MPEHIPVLCKEVINFLGPVPQGIYVDCTLGDGGHSRLILESTNPDGKVIGIDCDEESIIQAKNNLDRFGDRIVFVRNNFMMLETILNDLNITKVDGILLDLGVSSRQINKAERGFSFQKDACLDMRMNNNSKLTAKDIVNCAPENELQKIFFEYGEERWSRKIVRNIVIEREKNEIATTQQLVKIIEKSVPGYRQKIHPATRVFQALRIAVNKELENLGKVLPQTVNVLKTGGKILVISFHSLEDRIVKNYFKTETQAGKMKIITKKPVTPTEEEIMINPRARSAKG